MNVKKPKAHADSCAAVSRLVQLGAVEARPAPVCPAAAGRPEDEHRGTRSCEPAVMEPSDGSGSPRHAEPEAADRRGPWSRFCCWLECVCVVTFDLELGQAIEVR